MSRSVALTGMALVLLGLVVFLWKAVRLDLPVRPAGVEGLWRVELEISARGSGRGSVRAPLPSSEAGQVIFDEHSSSDRLLFTIRTEDDQRTGIWSGRLRGVHAIVHGFRVELSRVQVALPSGAWSPPSQRIQERWGRPTADFPAAAPEVADTLETLRLPGPSDPAGRLRMIFSFVSDEIAPVATGSDHALLTLATREGRPEGQARLLVTLLRAAGIPARPVLGLHLRADVDPEPEVWVEAWAEREWIPMSPSEGFFGGRPADRLTLRRGSLELVEGSALDAVGYRYRALRERLRPEELAAMMVPAHPILASLSLYRLPLGTQAVLRALLLLPLGALVVALFRNVIGVSTFGTFMPILIAFALRSTSLWLGLAMVGAVIGLGIASRLVLDRLRLLLVPRLSVLLCIVVLGVTALALLGRGFGERDLSGGVLLPMVILTMLVERFSVTMSEEGLREALGRAGYSTLVAIVVYPIFRSPYAEHLMFSFPELAVTIIGLLVWIGGYTGYRISDLIRFRTLVQGGAGGAR